MPTLSRPDVDLLEGLTTAIIVDQERMGGNPRSTVGTATDANAMLRILFSRIGQPHIGSARAFAFNIPSVRASGEITVERGGSGKTTTRAFSITGGMCPRCEGMGSVTDVDLSALFDETKSLAEGALTIPGYTPGGWAVRMYTESGFVDPDKPIRDYTEQERHDFLYREPSKVKINGINITYEGLVPRLQKSLLSKDIGSLQPHIRAFVERAVTFTACPDCGGTRLSEAARSSKIGGISIADACAMQISDLAEWVRGLDEPSVAPLLGGLRQTLDSFVEIGLGYLSLDRSSGTLSGGEAQRVKMIRHIGSSLTDVTYVFDEPTTGLHPHDIARTNRLLLQLRDKGNTVLVIEHEPEVIEIADHVVDLGPGAGSAGGAGVLRGDGPGPAGQRHAHRAPPRLPGRAQAGHPHARRHARDPSRHAAQPAGRQRGHSPRRALRGHRRGRIGQELADPWLDAERRRRGLDRPGADPRFAAQQSGDLHRSAGPDPGDVRQGERGEARAVQRELRRRLPCLQRQWRHLHRAGVHGDRGDRLRGVRGQAVQCQRAGVHARRPGHQRGARHVGQPRRWPSSAAARRRRPRRGSILARMADVGLGYLRLGQPLTTLSGGERQRLKLAIQMAPTAGSTSSTSRPRGCTWRTSSSSSACSTGWWTRASR